MISPAARMSASETDCVSCSAVMRSGRYCGGGVTVTGVRALAVGNGNDFDTGFVGHRLREHGYVFTECHRERPTEWPSLDGFDLVLALGSEWNVYRPETSEFVDAEAALLREAVA